MFKNLFKKQKTGQKRIYLDYAAATPVDEEVLKLMQPYFSGDFGNPSAIYKEGVKAREVIEERRSILARTLRVRASGITFTSGGTESNNLAIYGLLLQMQESNKVLFSELEIITTAIEHPSVSKTLERLQEQGVIVHECNVDEGGRIDEKQFASFLNDKTALVTFAYANSEIGVVQDIKRLTRIVHKFNTENNINILVHLDASQAPLWLSCEMDMLGVDLMTLDAGKCYGPKGAGVLARKHGVLIKAITLGGDQESGLRAGTENTPLIVGCVESIIRAQNEWKSRSNIVTLLRDFMIERLLSEIDGSILNGSHEYRIANNVNISIPAIDSEFTVITLDAKGVAVSTKSACSGATGDGSGVVRCITGDEARAMSTIRFSLGKETTKEELEFTVQILKEHVTKMRID